MTVMLGKSITTFSSSFRHLRSPRYEQGWLDFRPACSKTRIATRPKRHVATDAVATRRIASKDPGHSKITKCQIQASLRHWTVMCHGVLRKSFCHRHSNRLKVQVTDGPLVDGLRPRRKLKVSSIPAVLISYPGGRYDTVRSLSETTSIYT